MVNIARFKSNDDVFDNMFRGFLMRPVPFEEQPEIQIKIDVKENDKNYTVHAEIPGVKKEDIHVTIEGNQVALSAEIKKHEEVKKDDKILRSERFYGKLSRIFNLAQDVDEENSQAKYADGILELTLPKKLGGKSKKLMIM